MRTFKARSLDGLQLIPAALVPLVRPLLQSQGINPNTLTDSGTIKESDLIAMGFDTVEIRTAYSPPVKIPVNGPPNPNTERLLRLVQPHITLSGRAGKVEIAPFGKPSGISQDVRKWGVAAGLTLGAGVISLLLIGALLGRVSYR